MFYSKWYIYRQWYLGFIRQRQLNSYLALLNQEIKPLFIHINRTAGSSIAAGLGITQIHLTLSEYEQIYLKKYNKEFPRTFPVIASIRNPFDRVASEYYYRKLHNQNKLKTNPIPFEEWVEKTYLQKSNIYRDREIMFMQQYKWLESAKDYEFYLVRFESLEQDYKLLQKQYGATKLPWKKPSNKPAYKAVFTPSSREIIEEVCKDDLNKFNYSF